MYTLCQDDGSRNPGTLHFSDRQKFVCINIGIDLLRRLRRYTHGKRENNKQYLKAIKDELRGMA